MNKLQREKLLRLSKAAKSGKELSKRDFAWLGKMFEKYPEEYKKISSQGQQQAIDDMLGPLAAT